MWMLALFQTADACIESGPQAQLVFPDDGSAVASDVRVLGYRGPGGGTLSLLQDGVEVPTEGRIVEGAFWPGSDLVVLSPTMPLAPGQYEVVSEFLASGWTFSVDGRAETAGSTVPVPLVRSLTSEQFFSSLCGSGDQEISSATYRLCGADVVQVAVVQDAEPISVPLDQAPVGWTFSFEDTVDLTVAVDLGADDVGTAWFGTYNGAGVFSGWSVGDAFEMPARGFSVTDRMMGAPGGAGTTPTQVSECPAYGEWRRESERSCLAKDGGPECQEAGCSTMGRGASMWFGLLAVFAIRRRGAR